MSGPRSSARWWIAAGLCLTLLMAAAWGLRRYQAGQHQRERGAALFHGELPLVARLQGHVRALPTTAVRCSNCHEALNKPLFGAAAASNAAGPRPYAGAIQGDALTTLRSRRGGPPSRYDEAGMCALLRTGIDPAQIMIANAMPRYEPSAADCADLWAYLRHEPA